MSDQNNAIQQSVTVSAPAARVFQALTDATQLVRWFPTRAKSDAKPGGALRLEWDFAASEQNGTQDARYLEVVANKRLTYSWLAGTRPTTVEFDLEEAGGQTVVRLNHSGFGSGKEAGELHAQHAGPWTFYLANLKSYLEKGEDGRAAMLKQVTA